IDELGAARLERPQRLLDAGAHAGLLAGLAVLARDAHAQPRREVVEPLVEGGGGPRDGRAVLRVVPGDRGERERRVLDRARERADLVERAREREQPVAADEPVRRLEPDDAAERGGLADGAARVR